MFSGSTWSGWTSLGGFVTSDPAIVNDGAGGVFVFGRGGGNDPYVQRFNGSAWSGWTNVGGEVIDSVRGMTAI
jgi:hypothetical protein